MPETVITPWWELAIKLDETLADDAAALLISEGADGAEVLCADMPAPKLPRLANTPDASAFAEPGMSVVLASFAGGMSEVEVLDAARQALGALGLPAELPLALRRRNDTEWAESWKQFFVPLAFGERLWVVPSWDKTFTAPAGAMAIKLDPGLAFGTGQHATTALCLEILADGLTPAAARLLDVGCGSGILAIGAALLGCRHIVAVDSDATAVTVTRENAALNAVADRIAASADDLSIISGEFDWVMANIIAPVLVELAAGLAARLGAHGSLVLSGVLAEQEDEVLAAFTPLLAGPHGGSLRLRERRQRGEWIALRLAAD